MILLIPIPTCRVGTMKMILRTSADLPMLKMVLEKAVVEFLGIIHMML